LTHWTRSSALFKRGERISWAVEDLIDAQDDEDIDVPEDLGHRVREYLAENPAAPWEDAVRDVVMDERP
jgi:hypothetical protein